jgi:hypothetical protein
MTAPDQGRFTKAAGSLEFRGVPTMTAGAFAAGRPAMIWQDNNAAR